MPENPKKHAKKHALTPEMEAQKWKKGHCPNPNGRPKGSIDIWARIRRELLEKIAEGKHAGKEYADVVAKAFVAEALKGKWPQMKELIDREEGKVPDRVANADGSPVTFTLKIGERTLDDAG